MSERSCPCLFLLVELIHISKSLCFYSTLIPLLRHAFFFCKKHACPYLSLASVASCEIIFFMTFLKIACLAKMVL